MRLKWWLERKKRFVQFDKLSSNAKVWVVVYRVMQQHLGGATGEMTKGSGGIAVFSEQAPLTGANRNNKSTKMTRI